MKKDIKIGDLVVYSYAHEYIGLVVCFQEGLPYNEWLAQGRPDRKLEEGWRVVWCRGADTVHSASEILEWKLLAEQLGSDF